MEKYPNECMEDSDCNPYITNRLCYQGASWLDQLSSNASECQCNYFYGWEGENCDQFGTGTILSVAVYAIFGFASLIHFLIGVRRLHQRSKASPNTWYVPLTAANTTLIFVVIGLMGSTMTAVLTILNFLVVEDTPDKLLQVGDFGRFEFFTSNFGMPILALSCTMSQLNICLMWLDLGRESSRLQASKLHNLGKSRKIVVMFQVLLLICIGIAIVLQTAVGIVIFAALSFPFTIALIVLYTIGARQMHGLDCNYH